MAIIRRPWWSFLFLILFIILSHSGNSAVEPDISPKVIILNSYHPGFVWSDGELAGVLERLQQRNAKIDLSIEYLDTKRFPAKDHLVRMKDYLFNKYQGKKFDLVITLDDPALNMALEHRQELFPGVPLVFAGIDKFEPSLLVGQEKVTGVAEVDDLPGTLRLALSFHPDTKEVFVVHDYTISGLASRREVEEVSKDFLNQVKFKYASNASLEEIVSQIRSLTSNALILIMSFSTDSTGRAYPVAESVRQFTHGHKIPAYATHEPRLGHGIVGGILLGGKEHGHRAGDLAGRVLSGEDASQIPVDTKTTAIPMFDYLQLQRFNIPLNALPGNSIVINQPQSFYHRHKTLVHSILSVMIILVIAVIILAFNVIKRRQAENALLNSQTKLRSILDCTGEAILTVDTNRNITSFNPAFVKLLGYSAQEAVGQSVALIHPSPEQFQQFGEMVYPIIAKNGYWRGEWEIKKKDDTLILTEMSLNPQYLPDGSLIGFVGTHVDISERKRAENALRESEERHRTLIQTTMDGVWWMDIQANLVQVNQAYCQMSGYSEAELLAMKGWELEGVENKDEFETNIQRIMAAGKVRFESKHRRKDGSLYDIEISVQYLPSSGGRLVAFIRDIIDRKRAEEALRRSEERYRLLFNNVSDAIFVHEFLPEANMPGRFIEVNDVACQYLGYTRNELLQMSVPQIDAPEPLAKSPEIIKKLLIEGRALWEGVHLNKEGQNIPVEISNHLFEMDGKPTILSTVRNITERKQAEKKLRESEERYRSLVEGQIELVSRFKPDGTILYVNEGFCHYFGKSKEELLGSKWQPVAHPDDLPIIEELLSQLIPEDPIVIIENRTYDAKGEIHWVQFSNRAFFNEDGIIKEIQSVGRDITDRKLFEDNLRLSQARLAETNQLLSGVLDHTHMMAVFLDPQFNFIWVNRAYADTCKHEPSFFPGKNHFDLYPNAENQAIFQKVVKSGEPFFVEAKQFEFPDQPERGVTYWDWSLIPLNDDIGKVSGLVFTLVEVTDRIRTEQALRESEKKYRLLIETANEGIWTMDTDHVTTFVNQAMADMLGYTPIEILGKKVEEFFFAEDLPFHEQRMEKRHAGEDEFYERRFRRRDDLPLWTLVSAKSLKDNQGRFIGSFAMFTDITARKQADEKLRESEERFRTLTTLAPVGIYLTDGQGRCQYVNQRWLDMSGLTAEQALGNGWLKGLHPQDRELIDSAWKKMVDSEGRWGLEYRFQNVNGQVTWVSGLASPIRDINGQIIGYIGTNTDITYRKQNEDAQRISLTLLTIMNQYQEIQPLLEALISEIIGFSGCEAVGIRLLDEDGNIPYQAYQGFSQQFYEKESPLSIKIDRCMCINVINGTTNPNLPFYTIGGSFYMNGTTSFLATVPEKDKGQTRNVCNQLGYESVALIPLRLENQILGLIHLADRRENMVPLSLVKLLETIGIQLSSAILKLRAEEALRKSEEKFRTVANFTYDWEYWIGPNYEILYISPSCLRITGYVAGDFMANPRLFEEIIHPDDRGMVKNHFQHIFQANEDIHELEFRILTKEGEKRWISHYCVPVYNDSGTFSGRRASNRDITERKQVEEKILASLKEKEVLIIEVHHRVKNNMQIISTLLDIQLEHAQDQSPAEIFQDCQNRIRSMSLIHESLYQSENLANIEFRQYLEDLATRLLALYATGQKPIEVNVNGREIVVDLYNAIPLALIANEIIINSLKHAFPGERPGEIWITTAMEGQHQVIEFKDNGIGLGQEINLDNPQTFGWLLISNLVKQINGSIEFSSNGGTSCKIIF